MPISIVAPCGLICDLCWGFQREKNKCAGCTEEGSKPSYCTRCVIVNCAEKNKEPARSCNTCSKYPCKRLKVLEKRYSSNYGESLIDNFRQIELKGVDRFLLDAEKAWTCRECGNLLTVHHSHCKSCNAVNSRYLKKPKQPKSEVIAAALGDVNSVYLKFIEQLRKHDIQLEWHYYTDGRTWLAKGVHRWTGPRGGQNEKTVFWLSVWDHCFKVSVYVPEKVREGLLGLPLDEGMKQMIADSRPIGKLRYFPLVFDFASDEMFSSFFSVANFRKKRK